MPPMLETLATMWPPLLLLLIANGAPVVAARLLGERCAWPLDSGRHFIDGRPLFGARKSWRGLLASLLATMVAATLLGLAWWQGACFALLAMVGDVAASFLKRRLAIPPQGCALGLDQLPEALLPLWLMRQALHLDSVAVLATATLFMLLELILSPLLYRIRLRTRPY